MAVVTISREFGSGGDAVAGRLCALLGYRAFGKREIVQTAEEMNLSMSSVIDYSEDNHEVQSFLDVLMGRKASAVQRIAWSEDPSIAARPEEVDLKDTVVLELVKRSILAAAQTGDMVIIGRGGQALLGDLPGVLHARIEAPIEQRIRRVMQRIREAPGEGRPGEDLLLAASDIIVSRDMASADYIRRYYGVEWDDTSLYHLVLYMGRLNTEQAARILAEAVRSLDAPAAP